MKIQIKNVSSHQTSKVFSLILALMTLPFAIIGVLSFVFTPNSPDDPSSFPFFIFIFAPIIYGLFGYFSNRLLCFLYNLISKRFGGIEFVIEEQNHIKSDLKGP